MGVLEERQAANEEWRGKVEERFDEVRDTLADFEEKFNRGNVRFDRGEQRMSEIESKVDMNNAMTARIEGNVTELLHIFTAFQGFVRVGGWMGSAIKWFAALALALGILVYVWKTGNAPGPK